MAVRACEADVPGSFLRHEAISLLFLPGGREGHSGGFIHPAQVGDYVMEEECCQCNVRRNSKLWQSGIGDGGEGGENGPDGTEASIGQ
jgi:hypothetical protein